MGLDVGAAAGGGDKTSAAIAAIGECGAEELDYAGEGGDNAPDLSSFPSWLLLPSLLPLLLSLRLRLRLRLRDGSVAEGLNSAGKGCVVLCIIDFATAIPPKVNRSALERTCCCITATESLLPLTLKK